MKYGEIISLGRHKLMCGDATRREDVYKLIEDLKVNLVFTDPPYGVQSVDRKSGQIGGGGKTKFYGKLGSDVKAKKYAPVLGDCDTDMIREHYKIMRSICPYQNNLGRTKLHEIFTT